MKKINTNRVLELFKATPTPALVLLPDKPVYTIKEANEAYTMATKSQPEDLINHGIFDAFPENPEEPNTVGIPDLKASLERVLEKKEAHELKRLRYDIPLRNGEGFEEKYWLPKNIPVFNDKGEIDFILHTVTDVTNQTKAEQRKKKAEKDRDESAHHLKSILESMDDALYVVNKKWNVTYWNRETEKLIGISEDKARGKNLWEIFPADQEFYKNFHEAMDERDTVSFESWYDPARAWLEVNVYPCADGISVFLKDISDRKKYETERERLIRELITRNRELRQFSYITSHNLREPVTTLQSLISLMENQPADDREFREVVGDFAASVEKINTTVEDLVKVLIIKDKPAYADQEEVFFEDSFEQARQKAKNLSEQSELQIETGFQVPSVIFNKSYMESIFSHLLANSVKFRSSSKKLKISVKTEKEDDHILLTFQDNGVGLDVEQHQEKLFGLYQKFHSKATGKGLGLFLVKSQVEAFGGSIEARSDSGEGMTILIRFKKE
ncbi:MAG: ATP-binding protein [Balneolaceae bacterium]